MPKSGLRQARQRFVNGISRIAHFWGFPKAMGAVYAAVYLSPEPLSLDGIVEAVGVTKGGLVAHLRSLERLGIVERQNRPGDRKDYYVASSDFRGIVRKILQEREKREFDRALSSVEEALAMLAEVTATDKETATLVAFYRERLGAMQAFFKGLDRVVATVLAMDSFRRDFVERLLGKHKEKEK
ncbi:MAG: hypothetical protein QM784_05945 [Polyangiaceae bacterium]